MKIKDTKIDGLKVITPKLFDDSRGYFYEIFNKKRYEDLLGINSNFLQDNISYSSKNVLRGLHFQKKNPQGKLVYVTHGSIFDLVIDLRKNSPTFGENFSIILSNENKKQMWIPPGFAHGFLVLSEFALFNYKCDNYYDPNDEFCIKWNDPDLNIKWPYEKPLLSKKDQKGQSFKLISFE